jgi:acyl-CoA dehydrogenase
MTIIDVRGNTVNSIAVGSPGSGEVGAPKSLRERAAAVAVIAAANAETVDRDGVFPQAAIAAAKRAGFMSLLVPKAYGGEEASLTEVAEVCYTLGQACASTAMIVAMHQAALACVTRHCRPGDWHEGLLRRVAAEQLLFASSTTEGRGGGNVRSSAAPLTGEGSTP